MGPYETLAQEVGALVDRKNVAYGSSFDHTGDFFRLLYPNGIRPEQYTDALTLVRMFDKMMRLANQPGAFGEDAWADLCGYSLLGMRRARAGNTQ